MRGRTLHKVFLIAALMSSASAAYAQLNPRITFVAEYIREIGEFEQERELSEQEIKDNPANILAACISSSERLRLLLETQISMMNQTSFKFAAPFDEIASSLAAFYTDKRDLWQQFGDNCAALIAGPKPGVDLAKLAAETPKIRARLEFIDKSIFQLTPMVFALLIDNKPNSKNQLDHLIITHSERDKLSSDIRAKFGSKIDQEHENYIVSSAEVLNSYLTKDYKCADDPWQ